MSFPGSLLPGRTPKGIADQGAMLVLQDRILQYLLFSVFVLGGAGLFVIFPLSAQMGVWNIPTLTAVLLIGIAAIAILRQLPFPVRAGMFLAVIYLLDIQLLLYTGMSAITVVILFALVFFAGMFFGEEMAGVALVLWLAAGLTNIFTPGHTITFLSIPSSTDIGLLGLGLIILTIIGVGISVVVAHIMLANQYERSLKKEQQVSRELNQERGSIEERLREQTSYYQRRLLQAQTAAEISRSISTILDTQTLLQSAVDLMLDRFNLYYIGVFVLDTERKFAILKAGTGEAGKKMLNEHHRLQVGGTSMVGWTTLHRAARIALDTGSEAVRFNNPHLPHTRSELALPISARGEIQGALSVQSTLPDAFDQDDLVILQGIADSLGAALENARLYQETEDTLEETRSVNRVYLKNAWDQIFKEYDNFNFSYENPAVPPVDNSVGVHEFPLVLHDQVVGYLTLENDRQELNTDEKTFIENVTIQTAVALENARLLEEARRRALEELKLNDLTDQFYAAVSIDEILKGAVSGLSNLPSVAEVSIHLIPPETLAAQIDHIGNAENGNGRTGQEDR